MGDADVQRAARRIAEALGEMHGDQLDGLRAKFDELWGYAQIPVEE
jgi:hypothetical protein